VPAVYGHGDPGHIQIDVVRLNFEPVGDALNRHFSVPREQLVHHAAKVWRQVLDHNETAA